MLQMESTSGSPPMQISVPCQKTSPFKPSNFAGNQVLPMLKWSVHFKWSIQTMLLPPSSCPKTRMQMVSKQLSWTNKSKRSEALPIVSSLNSTSKTRTGEKFREFKLLVYLRSHQTRCWQMTRRSSGFTGTKTAMVTILVSSALGWSCGSVANSEWFQTWQLLFVCRVFKFA